MTRVNLNIPDDIQRAFKAKCAREGTNQTSKIIELIQQYLIEGEQNP